MTRERIQLIEAENVSYRKIFDRLNSLVSDVEDGKYRNEELIVEALKRTQNDWETLRAKYDLLLERTSASPVKRRPGPSRS
jgi:hypothetical protein